MKEHLWLASKEWQYNHANDEYNNYHFKCLVQLEPLQHQFILRQMIKEEFTEQQLNYDRIRVTNIIGNFALSLTQINLHLIVQKIACSRYNPKKFPAVIIRRKDPIVTILLFKSGRGIILGTTDIYDLEIAARRFAKSIEKATSLETKVEYFRIINMIATANLGFKVDFGRLAEDRRSRVNESFPGQPIKKVLIFKSGKMILVGATDAETLQRAFLVVKKEVRKYEIKQPESADVARTQENVAVAEE